MLLSVTRHLRTCVRVRRSHGAFAVFFNCIRPETTGSCHRAVPCGTATHNGDLYTVRSNLQLRLGSEIFFTFAAAVGGNGGNLKNGLQ
jgi:hypothetical protein